MHLFVLDGSYTKGPQLTITALTELSS